jgi:hypothetical protein
MSDAWDLALLLLVFGAILGSGLGLAVFTTGLYRNFEVVVVSFTLIGSTSGLLAGMILRHRTFFRSITGTPGFWTALVVLSIFMVGALYGLKLHSSSLVFACVLGASAALFRLIADTSMAVAIAAVLLVSATCLGAFIATRSASWFIIAALFILATVARRRRRGRH